MNTLFETRALAGLEIREADVKKFPGSIGTLVGYPAKFNLLSRDLVQNGIKFRERVMPGAFARSLAQTDDIHDVRALVGHDKTQILARRSAGTLELVEDGTGLQVRMHLIDTTMGRDALANVKARNLDAMSFGFLPKKTNTKREDGVFVRELADVDLAEVSIVAWAQYEDTEINARDLAEFTLPVSTPYRLMRAKQDSLRLRAMQNDDGDTCNDYADLAKLAGNACDQAEAQTKTITSDSKYRNSYAMDAHLKASALHQQAAKLAPTKEQAKFHRDASAEHLDAAEAHRKALG